MWYHTVKRCPDLNISLVNSSIGQDRLGYLNFCQSWGYIYVSVLRHEVAYFDCSAKALSLCLNPASRRCDPMEACAQGASLTGMKPSWQCAEVRLRERCGSREAEALLEAPSGWGVRIGYYGQRKWTLGTVVNVNKPKELWGLNQNGKWVVRVDCRTSDTGNTLAGRQSGPKVFAVRYVERGNPMPSPLGQANRKACCGRYGVRWWKKPRPSCNGVDTGWESQARYYPTRKGADVHRVLRWLGRL
jgi:hypothetical protein